MWDILNFYRVMLRRARYCYGKSSVREWSYRDHIDWNSSKIISPLVSLGSSLSADCNIRDLLQGEHPEILAGIWEGHRKSGFRRTKALISLKHSKTGPRLLLRTNRKLYTRFRLVPKSTTSVTSKRDLRSVVSQMLQNWQYMSVTLKYRDQIGRNTSKIIQRLISLVFSICRDRNIIYLLQTEHHEISAETGIQHMTCYILNIVSHSNLLLNVIYVWRAEGWSLALSKLGYTLTCSGCRWRTVNRTE